jgi:nitrogen regulation protein NR(I)
MAARILIADDELNIRKVLSATLRREGYEVLTAKDGAEAIELLGSGKVQVVVTDLKMPRGDGIEVLQYVQHHRPQIPVIIITAHGTISNAVEALKSGALDYITKPFDKADLIQTIAKAVRTESLASRNLQVEPDAGRDRMIGRTPAMRAIYEMIDKVADTPSTVLITGESGTGKELIAAALHERSQRAPRPFIKINCAAIPRELMESELFGHEKGAFTGAVSSKPGRFELADGGTLFLDEIADIPIEMQVKLLRALQEGEIERVGGLTTQTVDVRLVAATNRDLQQQVEQGRFREDLYYRLAVVPIRLPPLRERAEDIPLLVEHFIAKYNARLDRQIRGIQAEALELLKSHHWPGNIRELENAIERCILFSDGPEIGPADLPEELLPVTAGAVEAPGLEGEQSLKAIVKRKTAELEKDLIVAALAETAGNVTQAARRLKISRKSLQNKMKEFGLRESG